MKIKLDGDMQGFEEGTGIIGQYLHFEVAADGLPVKVERRPGNIEVLFENGRGIIRCDRKIHFFRALGLLIQALREQGSCRIIEEMQFDMNGAMFDVSRNAVMKVESIKKMILHMALMGLDMFMLYTEDTYMIKQQPYFGYMRGRYSYEELKECDDYADIFGIEVIPCIQTLAHLPQFLQWHAVDHLKDIDDILLAGSEDTYELIEQMIEAASAPFRSRRIHIGMDEAHQLGLGKYLKKNGYRRRFDIMNEHLKSVLEITERHGLKPMIWSDMYFRLGSVTGYYYDLDSEIPEDVVKSIPRNLQLVYWDYYHLEECFYHEFIKKHKNFGSMPVFAGCVWTYTGFGTNYGKTFVTSNHALNACKKQGVREVFATVWMNNGSTNNHFSSMLGLQLFAEHGYSRELDYNKLKRRFEFCTGANYNAFMDLNYLDETPGIGTGYLRSCNPSKFILWQDILTGLFDKHIEGLESDMESHYASLEEKMKRYACSSTEWRFIFEVPQKLCTVLKTKCSLGLRIKQCYDRKDTKGLKEIALKELPQLAVSINELRTSHRKQWFGTCKPFGWEVADLSYGGILMRIDTAAMRIMDYICERIDRIDELEEEKLSFDGKDRASRGDIGGCNYFNRIFSANYTQC